MLSFRAVLVAAALHSCVLYSASANDSAAALSIGGLQFMRSPQIEMRREDLRISLDRISIRYEFFNTSTAPITLTVAFPLPDIDLAEGENISYPSNDPLNFVNFETRVDDKPVKFETDQRAFVGDKEVTAQLREFNVPLLPIGASPLRVQELPAATRTRMAADGLLIPAGSDERGRTLYSAGWTVKTAVYREQTFSPQQPLIVEHTYRPSVGASPDTILRRSLRQDKALAQELSRYRKEYCVSDAFLNELDKIAGSLRNNAARVQERRLSYVLKTGANWAGSIKRFNMTIDRGSNLVSYCSSRLSASAAAPLEVFVENFTPDQDIKLLFVGKF